MWKAGDEVRDIMMDLISKYHPHLATADIAIIFKEKASKAGGRAILGKSKKAPPLANVLGDTKYVFVIELASDEWEALSQKQQYALLDHHLCSMRGDEDPQNGEMKYYLVPPDFSAYFAEIERHGVWRTPPVDTEEGQSIIEQLFGAAKEGEVQ
jgi:hypothetical protein